MFNTAITLALRGLSTFAGSQKPLLFSGAGAAKKLADLIVHAGQRRPLLVADSARVKNGLLDALIGGDAGAHADRFIARVDALAEEVGIPVNLNDVRTEDILAVARAALSEARRSYAVPRAMRRADAMRILHAVSAGGRDLSFA